MASEAIVRTWCDVCLAKDMRMDATPYPRMSIGRLTRDIDLCEQCREVPDAFKEWLTTYGAKVDQEAERNATPGPRVESDEPPLVCLAQGCPSRRRPFGTLQSLRAHVRTSHGLSLHELGRKLEAAGIIPVDPHRPALLVCDAPGCDFKSDGAQGLATHKIRAHAEARGNRPRTNGRRRKSEVVA